MRLKSILLVLLCLGTISTTEAQFLKKLKKKAEQALERTIIKKTDSIVAIKTEKTIDGAMGGDEENASQSNRTPPGTAFANPSLDKNTANKKAWYTIDVKVTYFDKEKQSETISYFDADAIAMESRWTDINTGKPQTAYADSEGFFIAYNETEKQYEKTALLSMPGMSMMAPSMMSSAYKLPTGAIYEAMEAMQNKGLAVYPFMHVDFPFVLKPEHFRNEMVSNQYKESKQSCRGSMGCKKFSVLEAGYEGSYTLFDNKGRLAEINMVMKDNPNFGSDKGKIEYIYEETEVNLPEAVEKKMLGQDLFKKGLDSNRK